MEFHEPPFQIDAFESLVQEMTPALYRFAYGLVGNNTDAEDALQETWLDVYHSIDRIQKPHSIRIYIYRIANRRCNDILRKRYRNKQEPPCPVPNTDTSLSPQMQSALSSLSPIDRAIVCGRVLEEMSYRELSAILSKPEATLRKRYERAMKKLQTALNAERSYYARTEK